MAMLLQLSVCFCFVPCPVFVFVLPHTLAPLCSIADPTLALPSTTPLSQALWPTRPRPVPCLAVGSQVCGFYLG